MRAIEADAMPNEPDPIVGQRYLHRDKGEMLRAVTVDSGTACAEIQYLDAEVLVTGGKP